MTAPLRVVLADDAALIREGLAGLLRRYDVEVVAEVGDATGLLKVVRTEAPDLAVVDIRLPPSHRTEGLAAAVEIRSEHPGTAVLLLSQYIETHYLATLLRGGAAGIGYLLKERVGGGADFVAAVRRVAAGGCVVDPKIVQLMLGHPRRRSRIAALTDREREVLAAMAQGRSNRAVAELLGMGTKTVETHVRRIFIALDLAPEPDDHRRVMAVLTYLREAPQT
jgi:DNA-binding NarL/FixJ family response regulator